MATGQNLTIANALLKDIYSKGVTEQINSETPALGNIKSTATNISNVGGAGVNFTVHMGRNQGIGARGEGERLPDAGQQTYARGTTDLKSLYGTIQATGQVMNQAKTDPQAFADVLGEEVTRLRTDLAKDQNRMMYRDGTGTLAAATAGDTTSFVVTVDNITWLEVGMRVDLLQASTLGNPVPTRRNPTADTFLTITAIDKATKVVTFDQEVATITSGDVIVRSGGPVNSWNKEWNGFGNIVSATGDLHGISATTYSQWQSVVHTSVGTLTELKMNAVVQDIRENGSKPTRVLTTPGCYNAYWNALQSMRQYVNKTDLEGGLGSLAFSTPYGNVPMLTDFDAKPGEMLFLNESHIFINTNVGWEWIDEQGDMWQKVAGYDVFVAEMRNYSQITTNRRNAHGKMTGVTEA